MKNATATVVKFPSQNGNGRPGTPGYRWGPGQRRNELATLRAKRKERVRAQRELDSLRKAAKSRKPVRKAAERVAALRKAGFAAVPSGVLKPATPRSGESLREQRSDAIVYLTAAAERTEALSNAELLAGLALRRLRGQIK